MFKGIKKFLCVTMSVCLLTASQVSYVEAATAVTPTMGIDVSKWQGLINWPLVAQSGVKFAIIRYGNTKKGLDQYFYYNMLSAQACGLKTGVYIYSYATTVEEAALEAQLVLNAVQNINVTYPIVFDIEDDSQKNLSAATLSLMANTFCAIIESEGYYPMVYSSKNWFNKKLTGVFYDKWVAQWDKKCDIADAGIWQYSCKGSISGIAGDVDLDFDLKDYSSSIIDTGWIAKKGFLYYYNNYKMVKGWLTLGDDTYYLDPYGRMVVGWMPMPDGAYYMGTDGKMAKGFTKIADKIFYFGNDGKMVVGPAVVAGLNFLFMEDGSMFTGWLNDGTNVMYYDTDGHQVFGLATIGKDIYYFDNNGLMQTGIQDLGGTLFLFDETGRLVGPIVPAVEEPTTLAETP